MATRPRDENQMKLKLAFAILLGAALGIGAIEMLHAQAKPPAYLISDITVNNETLFKEWADKINPTFAQFGAKYLVRGGQTIAIPGSGEPPKRTTLIVFESLDKARTWNESDAVSKRDRCRIEAQNFIPGWSKARNSAFIQDK
jgi:uncharacterized protein (DUF1330 family)